MNKKTINDAIAIIKRRDLTPMQKGNILMGIVGAVGGVALGVLLIVVIAIVVTSFQSTVASTTVAWTIANNTLTMLQNFSNQLGLAGTIFGFVVVFGGLALLGYYGYQVTAGKER